MVLKQHPRVAMIYDMTRAGTERSARAHRLDALWSRTTRASVSVSKVLYIVLGIGRTVLYRADGNHSEDTSKFFPFSAHEPERRGHRAPDRTAADRTVDTGVGGRRALFAAKKKELLVKLLK